tara:strand:+ start:31 stop:165 length:135 start_codon:yes stop_codon:yes gene_type:complete
MAVQSAHFCYVMTKDKNYRTVSELTKNGIDIQKAMFTSGYATIY